ncbi:hypothetical protein [Kitasatospora purpeofusca]|uniref:hypothetical protein n=1 Tax=Kitasatospora purpeofusca TaxID=67352 RepID=UPI002A5ACE6D|nr:hypothetical protein [Kitasatospora purpeofusca]MDY0812651.1 hypothetical protein [Kitasatospora purpeofusca]
MLPEELGTQQGALTGFGDDEGSGFGWYPAIGCMLFLVMPALALVRPAGAEQKAGPPWH